MRSSVPAVLTFLVMVPMAWPADDPPPGKEKKTEKQPDISAPTEKELADKRIVFMKSALDHFSIRVGDRKENSRVSDPCLRWTNSVGEGDTAQGIVAVYAHNKGRPDALAKFFLIGAKKWVTEFAIIAEKDVAILRSGDEFWKPSEYVCKFSDLPKSPVPADKPALRMAQMRTIAADFSVVNYFGVKEEKQNMRLLTQPVYRYAEEGKILDGAVFVFAIGTDAECCVLVEAAKDDKGSHYRYAVAPMSIFKLEVSYKDAPVWQIERRMFFGDKCRSYFARDYVPDMGEKLPE
jgi:hypothetical protein